MHYIKTNKWRLWALLIVATATGVLLLTSTMPKTSVAKGKMRVVIDAGHGGKDPGNLGTGRYKVTEKTVALNVARQVGDYIKNAYPDVEVLYTRDTDVFVPLHERTKFANTKNADLFISIHCDAFTRESAKGCGSYVMGAAKTDANLRMAQRENQSILLEDDRDKNYGDFDPNSPEGLIELSLRQNAHIHQSLKFAKKVQDQMRTRVGREDRGVKQAPFWVISFTTMPSILIELGFLTNKEEEDFLVGTQGQEYISSAIYRAFKEYKTELENVESTLNNSSKPAGTIPAATNQNTPAETTQPIAAPVATGKNGVVFKVQLLSSSKKLELKPENFDGLDSVEEYRDNEMYKYLWGAADDYEAAKNLQKTVRNTGYKGAFIVAFDADKKRIPLDEAIKKSAAATKQTTP
jgi:N-acetylmuramoyl-L-alanine amidase